ncbi:hypothetical protein RB195_009148 [Necator americanus]|uniref:Core-2/I-Branching enzyme n=1 Tax=Necator americanus TaxID=51031 RepID=A0ABR1CTE8_NECAM
MTRHPYQLLGVRSLNSGRRRVLKEVLLPILVGISIGYVLGLIISFEETDSIEHLVQIEHDVPETTLFFLRCVILVHPEAKRPLNFMTAIRDTYGSICNQTIYYTNSKEMKKKAGDQYVVVVDSNSNGFYWNYFKTVVEMSSEVPAQWTYVGDEQGSLSVENLRRLVRTVNHRKPIIFGRIFVQKSFLYYIFPFLHPERISLQSGIVLSTSAIKNLSQCKGYFLPRATESTLFACAKETGIQTIDPVDEDGMHLFHEKDMKTLIPEAYGPSHQHGDVKSAAGCCSDHAISFGQMSFKDIRLADFASLHWRVFGMGGFEEVNASYAIDPNVFLPKTTATLAPKNISKALPKSIKQQTRSVPKPPSEQKKTVVAEKKEKLSAN